LSLLLLAEVVSMSILARNYSLALPPGPAVSPSPVSTGEEGWPSAFRQASIRSKARWKRSSSSKPLPVTLPRLVGVQAAQEMLYTGRRIPGEEAARLGLCDRLVPIERVRDEARSLAREIAGSAPLAVASIRETLRGDLARAVRAATERELSEQEQAQYDLLSGKLSDLRSSL